MRFNDLLRTVLANMGDGTVATVTRWRQCIDLLAQYDVSGAGAANALAPEDRDAILTQLEIMRPQLSVEQRVSSVVELGGRLRSAGLVRLLGQDHPTLVAAMMATVTLSDADWVAIIPDLGPLARSVLRRRADLGPGAIAALQRFGTVDLALTTLVPKEVSHAVSPASPGHAANDRDEAAAPSQIGRIVARIERFTETRQHRRGTEPDGAEALAAPSPSRQQRSARPRKGALIQRFTFETDSSGVIRAVVGAPRGAVVGLSIGSPASDGRYGADGRALGAFRHRAAFENARFTIGEGLLAGEWRLSATPRFDAVTGRFLDYVGDARRELPHEGLVKVGDSGSPGWAGLSAASTRQLIHELRTPLNAIQGYAEMIEAQLVGPVSSDYRGMAGKIMEDARTLLRAFDDLDLASRLERGDHHSAVDSVDLPTLVHAVVAGFGQGRDTRIDIAADPDLTPIGGDRMQVERMLAHLIRAGRAALGEQERLSITLVPGATPGVVEIVMRRPLALASLPDEALFDHDSGIDNHLVDAPQLGLAFTLRLVRGIATHLGGQFDMTPHSFRLTLPIAADRQEGQGNGI
ncbi:MAG TPA: histidine kinase dimerization/phospho-acceptor domain-containing protein [Sphingobium sp.]|nr:histidine kinase dimerization/phospho-acceptor domain-containing protein [Sphingobium sp.]